MILFLVSLKNAYPFLKRDSFCEWELNYRFLLFKNQVKIRKSKNIIFKNCLFFTRHEFVICYGVKYRHIQDMGTLTDR